MAYRDLLRVVKENDEKKTNNFDGNSYENRRLAKEMNVQSKPVFEASQDNRSASQVAADIYKLNDTSPDKANSLMSDFETLRDDKASKFYSPYSKPTNTLAMQSLSQLGVDMSGGVNDDFFSKYAWLKNNQRVGIAGTPLAPTKKSSREESAAYYYDKLLGAEETTKKAEAEWGQLKNELSYWAKRSDRNYSDDEIIERIDWTDYPTLSRMDKEKQSGTPVQLNRAIGYDKDNLYGVIWSARNDQDFGDDFVNSVIRNLGEGKQYEVNTDIQRKLNIQSNEYNPYIVGSTLEADAALFGMQSFDRGWVDKMAPEIMGTGTKKEREAFQRIYNAEDRTRELEDELNDFNDKVESKINSIVKRAIRTNESAEDALYGYISDTYGKIETLIDGINRRSPIMTTRTLNFDYHGLVDRVEAAIQSEKARKNNIEEAQIIENKAVIKKDGDAVQEELAPKSETLIDGFWSLAGKGLKSVTGWLSDVGQDIGIREKESVVQAPEKGKPGASSTTEPMLWAGASVSDAPVGGPTRNDALDNAERERQTEADREKRDRTERETILKKNRREELVKNIDEYDKIIKLPHSIYNVEAYQRYSDAETKKMEAKAEIDRIDKELRDYEIKNRTYTDYVPDGYKSENKSVLNRIMKEASEKGWKSAADIPKGKLITESVAKADPGFVHEIAMYFGMSKPEIERYNYYFDTKGEQYANEYFKNLQQTRLNEEYRKSLEAGAQDFADKAPVLGSLFTVAGSIASTEEGFRTAISDFILGNDATKNDRRFSTTAFNQVFKQQVSKNVGGGFGSFAYDTGMSIAENALGMVFGGAGQMALVSGRSYASGVDNAFNNGANREQAHIIGIANAAFETITEHMDLDRLTSMLKAGGGKGAKEFLKGMVTYGVKSAIPEATEEVISEIGNTMADIIVMGDKSQVMRTYNDHIGEGMNEADAWADVAKNVFADIGMAGLGGAASGFVFGNFANIANNFRSNMNISSAEETFRALETTENTNNEGGQALSAQLTGQVINAYSIDQIQDSQNAEKFAGYQTEIVKALNLDTDSLNAITSKILKQSSNNGEVNLLAGVKSLANSSEKSQVKILNDVIAKYPGLKDIQTIAKLNMLKNASTETRSKNVDALIDNALLEATNAAAEGAGNLPENGFQFAFERWGTEGLLYIGNMLESGKQAMKDAAIALQSMPSFSQSVIVAEENMKSVSLSDEGNTKQLVAFNADQLNPEIIDNAQSRAKRQAIEARAQLIIAETNQNNADNESLIKADDLIESAKAKFEEARQSVADYAETFKKALDNFQLNSSDAQAFNDFQSAKKSLQQLVNDKASAEEALTKAEKDAETLRTDIQRKADTAMDAARAQAVNKIAEREAVERIQNEQSTVQQTEMEQPIQQEINAEQEADRFINEKYADASEQDKQEIRDRFVKRLNEHLGNNLIQPEAEAFDEKNKAFMSKIEKKFGVRFVEDDTMTPEEEASYNSETREIRMNKRITADKALVGVVMHEMTHDAKQSGWYDQYAESVLSLKYGDEYGESAEYQRDIDAKIARYSKSGRKLSVEQAIDELIAEETRNTIFADEESVNRFVEREPGIARRILDALNRIIKSIMDIGDMKDMRIERSRALLETALLERNERMTAPENITKITPSMNVNKTGKDGKVSTASGFVFNFHYALVNKDSLVASNNDDMTANEAYPEALQPRNRAERVTNKNQVENMAAKLEAFRLGQSPEVTSGAPVVGPDLVVESGNGRTMAIRRAMNKHSGKAIDYTNWLKDNAEEFGFNADDIQDDTILVRVRDTDVNRESFVVDANVQPGADYSPSELAKIDASLITSDMLNKATVDRRFDLDNAANNSFINEFTHKVVPETQRGDFTTEKGVIGQKGFIRMRNALFMRAYNDSYLVAELGEHTDDDVVKNVIKAMTNLSPRIAQLNDHIEKGEAYNIPIAKDMVAAYKAMKDARNYKGGDVNDYLIQYKMDEAGFDTSDTTEEIVRYLNEHKYSAKAMTGMLNNLVDIIENMGDPRQTALIDMAPVETPVEMVKRAERMYEESNTDTENGDQRLQYALKDIDNEYLDTENNIRKVAQMEAVSRLTGKEFAKGSVNLFDQVSQYFNSIGNAVETPAIGNVLLRPSGIKSSIAHKIGRNKAIAFAAVPDVLKKGKIIDAQENWKRRGYDTIVIAAPIDISEERFYEGVVVRLLKDKNDYYVHEVLIEKGTALPFKTGAVIENDGNPSGKEYPSIASLLQQVKNVNNNESMSLTSEDDAAINAEIDRLLKRYGAIERGESSVNTQPIPQQTSDGQRVRRFARTVSESGILNDEQRSAFNRDLVSERFSYEPISDKNAMDYAQKLDSRNLNRVWREAVTGNKMPTKHQMAAGERLLNELAQLGDSEAVDSMIAELSDVFTRAGQLVQSARLLKKASNAGARMIVERAVDKINDDIKGDQKVILNPQLMEQLSKAKTIEEREAIMESIYKDAGQQIPPTWKTRLLAWRYLSMLGNPRTHIRNIIGNAMFMPAIKTKNMIGAVLEKAFNTDKTKSVFVNKDLLRQAKADAETMATVLQGGGKYSDKNKIEQYRRSFGQSAIGKTLERIADANSSLLEKEDAIFLKRHYANALAGYLQANGLTLDSDNVNKLTEARQYAVQEAQKATYRDASALATALNDISRGGGIKGLVVEGILPFKKTPVNILKRGIEYSPIGLINTLTSGSKKLRNGEINASQFIDRIASGMTGTMAAALGLFLYNIGAIKIGGNDKDDEFRKQFGAQDYSIEVLGYSVTLEWMVPLSMPIFVGASVGKTIEEDNGDMSLAGAFNNVVQGFKGIMEPVFNLSMLDGVNNAIQSAKFSETSAAMEVFLDSVTNFGGQFVPTLLGQVARTVDPVRRRLYADKNVPIDASIQNAVNRQANKIPMLSMQSQPYLNVFGQEERTDSLFQRVIENFLSPAYINKINPDDVENTLIKLYEVTGNAKVLPKLSSKYFTVDNKRVDLSGPEYTKYTRTRGETMHQVFSDMMNDSRFAELDPEDKAAIIGKAVDYATAVGKKDVAEDYALPTWAKTAHDSNNPENYMFEWLTETRYEEGRKEYRSSAIKAIKDNDYESLEAALGGMIESHLSKNPDDDDHKAEKAAKDYLSDSVKKMYLEANSNNDFDLMNQIEDVLAEAGITYKYRNWLKSIE